MGYQMNLRLVTDTQANYDISKTSYVADVKEYSGWQDRYRRVSSALPTSPDTSATLLPPTCFSMARLVPLTTARPASSLQIVSAPANSKRESSQKEGASKCGLPRHFSTSAIPAMFFRAMTEKARSQVWSALISGAMEANNITDSNATHLICMHEVRAWSEPDFDI
ncbi:hypothetical protein BDW75DRAFT_237195 [Aspergillus navahoensis]